MRVLDDMHQVDPSYMASAVQAMINVDPKVLQRMQARQTQMLFSLSDDDRRAMIRMNMRMQATMTPEQREMLEEDARAVMEDMMKEQGTGQ